MTHLRNHRSTPVSTTEFLDTLTPTPDPELVTWTPEQGPLVDALAGLPNGHPVTLTDSTGQVLHCTIDIDSSERVDLDYHIGGWLRHLIYPTFSGADTDISATWRKPQPQPAWATPRPPLVVVGWTGVVHALRADGTYGCVESKGVTARELDHAHHGQVRVLIDADGNHVKESGTPANETGPQEGTQHD